MRQYIGLAALIFVGIAAWRIAGQLSADALGMAVGVLFGVMAGVPTALMVMASVRKRAAEEEDYGREFLALAMAVRVVEDLDAAIVYPGMPDDLIKDDVNLKLTINAKRASAG